MKTVILAFILSVVVNFHASAQTNKTTTLEMVSFKLKNNHITPKKVTLISYRPDEKGNGTSGFMLFSYATKKLRFPVGSKLFLANNKQVDVVMSGNSISNQKPFLEVKKEDDGKTFNID